MPPEILLSVAGVFVAIAAVVGMTTSWALSHATPEQRRIRAVTRPASSPLIQTETRLTDKPDPLLARLSRMLPKSAKDMSKLQRRLARGGYPRYSAVVYFSVAELLLPVVLFLGFVGFLGLRVGFLPGLFFAVAGYMAPGFYVAYRISQRQKTIRNGLPDALDLLTVCVEAGSGLDQGIAKASEELTLSHPQLADELRLITTEIRAGKPRLEAFQNFAARTGVDDVRTLVSMLVQTDRFGTSVADALRVHSETLRTKRRQAAEERAGKVGVKLVFPLVLCLFPALYVVCLGPVAIKIYRALILKSF